MSTSLATQLAQLAANSKSSLNVKAQKAAHSKSLIWEPRVAATQSYQTLYTTCIEGFDELCQLDARFSQFRTTLFHEESQNQDRMQLNEAENQQLDHRISSFLHLVGGRLRLMPAIKAVEWLIRRFRIHEENTAMLLLAFVPFHTIPAFTTLLSILPTDLPHDFRFLGPYARSHTAPPRSVFVRQAIQHLEFLSLFSEYTLESCRQHYHHTALISFWGGLITEATAGILERTASGRAAIQAENDQSLLHRIGPIFAESLMMKKIPSLQIASYMAVTVFVSRSAMPDVAVTAFMEQIAVGWTSATVEPGLISLAILAQFRSAKQMGKKITKALIKTPQIGQRLVEIGRSRQVDRLANGLCLALIEKLAKRGDSRGLPIIMEILSSSILQDRQIVVLFKSLLGGALKLDDKNDETGVLRRKLGETLVTLSRAEGKTGDTVQAALQDSEIDVEELEIKLDLSFRSQNPHALMESIHATNGHTRSPVLEDPALTLDSWSSSQQLLPSNISTMKSSGAFDELSQLFCAIVSNKTNQDSLLDQFDQLPILKRNIALEDCTYLAFYMRVWCGPFPALARTAALERVKLKLKASNEPDTDLQNITPYVLAALGDPSRRARQAAADLIAVMASLSVLSAESKTTKVWGEQTLYDASSQIPSLNSDITAKFLHLQLLPVIEECVLDSEHISSILKASIEHGTYHQSRQDMGLDKKNHMSQVGRSSLLSNLASHTVATPLLLVKARLLRTLNTISGVLSMTKTDVLLPCLKWWADLPEEQINERCAAEHLDKLALDAAFVEVVVPNHANGMDYLFHIINNLPRVTEDGLSLAVFANMRKMWPQLKDEVKFSTAQQLLAVADESFATGSGSSVTSSEAVDFLKSVSHTTNILLYFLESVHTGTKMITEPPPNKRRRTSTSDGNRGQTSQVTPELAQALRKITFVLQLVDSSAPESHPELLDGLFICLSELQHFRTVAGSELGYLQNLILRSLLAMMPTYKSNDKLKIDSSGGYGDLLVHCIQRSSSPVVQNSVLLLIASMATTAPNLVLHSVMPIFTFMGSSVLRQGDDYSAHVISQTIKEVIPPLIASLRKGSRSPVNGASDILVSFTTAYEHIPSHRRHGLFVALVETLGSEDFLFALVAMLVDRYGPNDSLIQFIVEMLDSFNAEAQLETLVKLLDLIRDVYRPKPGISATLFGINDEAEKKDVGQIALRQLIAYPKFLTSAQLKSQVAKMENEDNMGTSQTREQYAKLLENMILLSDTVKSNKTLHSRCGVAFSNLLNLLSISEFIKAVESLLDRQSLGLRQKVLRVLQLRIDTESKTSPESRTALLAFLPQLNAVIRESPDIRYKQTAVLCIDKIAEAYGKKDIEVVVAAATVIASGHCLGQSDRQLRILALLCLTSLADVLQDAIIPVLPAILPRTLVYLDASLQISPDENGASPRPDEELHAACYSLFSSLAQHVPYMLPPHLAKILEGSNKSAVAGLGTDIRDSRLGCLRLLAKQIEAKDMFSAILSNWSTAASVGTSAILELLDIMGTALDNHSKTIITKNGTVLSIILIKALDLRRQIHESGEISEQIVDDLSRIEASSNEKALKMIYKLNDASFRPIFIHIMEWIPSKLSKRDTAGRQLRQHSVFGLLQFFFGSLKSIVTSYASYIVDDAVKILQSSDLNRRDGQQLWARVLGTLRCCFEHDQDDFWQSPAHFGAVLPVLMDQFALAASVDVTEDLIPTTVELAVAADSQNHQKEMNARLLKHLRSEHRAVRLAAVKCQQALTDRLGEEWLSMLHEMLPRISELQEDDDEEVERETHRWIVKIEGVLGESLDSMLQ